MRNLVLGALLSIVALPGLACAEPSVPLQQGGRATSDPVLVDASTVAGAVVFCFAAHTNGSEALWQRRVFDRFDGYEQIANFSNGRLDARRRVVAAARRK